MFCLFGGKQRDTERYTTLYPVNYNPAQGFPQHPQIRGEDRGEPPVFIEQKIQVPASNVIRIVAPAPLKRECMNPKFGGCCGLSGDSIPLLGGNQRYCIQTWINENPVCTRIAQEDLQTWCDNSLQYTEKFRKKINSLLIWRWIVCILWVIIDIGLIFLLWTIGRGIFSLFFLIKLIWVLRILRCFNRWVYTQVRNLKDALVSYIEGNKESLIQRGVRPRPGAFGTFIEFTYT